MISGQQVLSGRYELRDLVGQGGMARVYRATDRVLERTVAVKVLSSEFEHDPSFVARFEREARAAAGLSHHGIVGIFDAGSDQGVRYIVMEFVEGQTVAAVLRERGRLPPDRATRIAADVCRALAVAHQAGLVHRDVKPANVIITPRGEVKVMDFGIARATTSDLTQTAMVLGTATYLSPEQALGQRVDARSDIYSLGVVLYEMLAGRPPFRGDTSVAVAYQHVREDPRPPSELQSDVTRELDGIVMKAMAKAPDRRYQTAEEFRLDLERAHRGEGVTAAGLATTQPMGPGPTEVLESSRTAVLPEAVPSEGQRVPGRPPRARRRWWPALLVIGAVLLAAAVVLALVLAGMDRPAAPPAPETSPPPRTAPETSPSPEPTTPSPTATTPTVASVDQAAAALTDVIEEGVQAGEIQAGAGRDMAHTVDQAVREYDHGDLDRALQTLSTLDDKVDRYLEDGKITSTERADQIHRATDVLADAMQATPPEG